MSTFLFRIVSTSPLKSFAYSDGFFSLLLLMLIRRELLIETGVVMSAIFKLELLICCCWVAVLVGMFVWEWFGVSMFLDVASMLFSTMGMNMIFSCARLFFFCSTAIRSASSCCAVSSCAFAKLSTAMAKNTFSNVSSIKMKLVEKFGFVFECKVN